MQWENSIEWVDPFWAKLKNTRRGKKEKDIKGIDVDGWRTRREGLSKRYQTITTINLKTFMTWDLISNTNYSNFH